MRDDSDRQTQVWALHGQGLSLRAIAQQLGLHLAQVQRCIRKGQEVVRERQTADQLADLAAWLTEQAKADHDASLKEADLAVAAGEWRNVPAERKVRSTIRAELARLHGQDPIRIKALELRQRQLQGDTSLREHLMQVLGLDDPGTP